MTIISPFLSSCRKIVMDSGSNQIECPICMKDFPASKIQVHASKCLFLSEPTNDAQGFLKGSTSSSSKAKSSPINKKAKSKTFKSNQNFTELSPVSKKPTLIINESSERYKSDEVVDGASRVVQKVQIDSTPLAERMRPKALENYLGQDHVLGKDCMLFQLLARYEIPNIILWGPPGCGKTSLANVIANICRQSSSGKLRYVKLSAAMSGVNEVREAANIAANDLKFGRRTVIFMDEIHRFNKAQQDIFLPHVEAGTITLVGATTENPSFSLNSALLSRCRVIVLEKLTSESLKSILSRAVSSLKGMINTEQQSDNNLDVKNLPRFIIDERTIDFLSETCDGDARIALGGLELAVKSKIPHGDESLFAGSVSISLEDVQENLKKTHMLYDRKGEQHYDMISALHKSVRASDENASLYWLTRMMSGGEDPVYIARRMVRMASEDIGLADPKALGIAVHTMHACKMMGMPECDVLLAQCVTYLARAPKSRLMEDALRAAQKVIADHKGAQPSVPLHLRNAPTKTMKDLGFGKGYNMKNKIDSGLKYLPEDLEDIDFFNGKNPVELN